MISFASALVSLSVFAQSTDQNYVKVDKYLFGGGYAQASVASATTDNFAFYFYNQDHLGNIREVVDASGSMISHGVLLIIFSLFLLRITNKFVSL